MFWTRLLSGIGLVIAALLLVGLGGPVLLAALALISLMGIYELNHVIGMEKKLPGIAALLAGAVYYLWLFVQGPEAELPLQGVLLWLMVLMCMLVAFYPRYSSRDLFFSFVSVLYAGGMLSYVWRARQLWGGDVVWLIFLSAWGSDTLAYCAGRLFGRHKMTPNLSPKKTWEGFVGGVAGAACLGAIYGAVFSSGMPLAVPAAGCALICFVGALLSVVGDLAASAIKREYQVKDYGHIIPGHGGIMDRFDSVLFTAPAIFVTASLLMH